MQPSAPLPQLAFFHVMKTGGMTFRETLQTLYGNGFWASNETTIEGLQRELKQYDCVEYHIMPRSDHWIMPHQNLVQNRRWDLLAGREVFTMLREPLDRYVSQYFYIVERRAEMEPVFHARGDAFPESIVSFGGWNEQVGLLAGKQSRWNIKVERSDLELAKEMLISLRANMGLLERFADSMNIFETVTGLQLPGNAIKMQNKTTRRPQVEALSPYLRDRIRERNLLDLELYEFGKELFAEQFARCQPTRTYSFHPPAKPKPSPAAQAETAVDQTKSATDVQTVVFAMPIARSNSFRYQVARMFGESYHMCDDPAVDAIAAQLEKFQCVEFTAPENSGDYVPIHRELWAHSHWDMLDGKQIFLLLHEPVQHTIVWFALMERVRPLLEERYLARGMRFPDTLAEFIEHPATQNSQLGFLTGKHSALEAATLDRADLDAMKEAFVRLGVHVGLTDRFDDSVRILEAVTGRQAVAGIPNLDPFPPCAPLDSIAPETIARIKELNALDVELYEFGRQMFLEDLKRYDLDRPVKVAAEPDPIAAPLPVLESKPAVAPEPDTKPVGFWAAIRSMFGRPSAQ